MPRRERPPKTERSEHWLRQAVNENPESLNNKILDLFQWSSTESIHWMSPIKSDGYAEYYDQEFLDLLGLQNLAVPLKKFWPRSGPRWDGLAKTSSGKVILVEAKAYIEEGVDYRSSATGKSREQIEHAIAVAKEDFGANEAAPWPSPFYQYVNRLAHLYYLHRLNGIDAYLLFLYFADAPDVPKPSSKEEWRGAVRLTEKCLGLGRHRYRDRVGTMIWSVSDMQSVQGQ